MPISIRVILLFFSLLLILTTTIVLKKGRMPIKYSLLWFFSAIIVFILSVFPSIIEWIAWLFGFQTLSNLISAIMFGILLFLTMALTIISAGQNKKINLLVQEVSILKNKIESNKKEKSD